LQELNLFSLKKSGKWRGVLPNEFQLDEFEIICKYMTLFNQHVISSVGGEVSKILHLYAKEFRFIMCLQDLLCADGDCNNNIFYPNPVTYELCIMVLFLNFGGRALFLLLACEDGASNYSTS
jgi:predicted nucleic-acid-binding Zn-ribbon protein